MKKVHWLVLSLVLSACGAGSGVEGTYTSDKGLESFTLHSNGVIAHMNAAGVVIYENRYKVTDNQLQFEGGDEPYIFNEDGSINGGPMHGTFTKK